ncbi:hypothetical protein PoB_000066300 [Plakobranchus ocellatus]|uniref:Uncharacterized protein n=1 Tax=Plakobranchus ocellatus TaxID=259542 RepID=A0AAV3XV47_9GAST|nr:hypothetical protein PoB_000066300 [Plakobranchus ocellatus]
MRKQARRKCVRPERPQNGNDNYCAFSEKQFRHALKITLALVSRHALKLTLVLVSRYALKITLVLISRHALKIMPCILKRDKCSTVAENYRPISLTSMISKTNRANGECSAVSLPLAEC